MSIRPAYFSYIYSNRYLIGSWLTSPSIYPGLQGYCCEGGNNPIRRLAMKTIIIILSLSFGYSYLYAQADAGIRGQVTDALTGSLLPNATIILWQIQSTDTSAMRKVINTPQGFIIKGVACGRYLLKASHMGYQDSVVAIEISKQDSLYNIGNLQLRRVPTELDEVIVKAEIPPMRMKGDTLQFNPGAFAVKADATVEELLKKLPGITVDGQGNVTVLGEKVQKIFVDGKVFFSGDPRLAIRNLPVDMLERVDAFTEKSEKAKLTGISDPDAGKVINLRLKPDRKRGGFGTAGIGYGSQQRYAANASANYFEKDTYLSGIFNSNNGGDLQGGAGPLHNQQHDLTLAYRDRWSSQLEATLEYGAQLLNSRSTSSSRRQTFLMDSLLLQDKQSSLGHNDRRHYFNLGLNYAIDSLNQLEVLTSWSGQQNLEYNSDITSSSIRKGNRMQPVNNASTYYHTTENGWSGNLSLRYHHRFKKTGRYLGLSINNGHTHSNGKGELLSITRLYGAGGSLTDSMERDQRSNQLTRGHDLAIGVSFTEPVGKGQVLDFSYDLGSSGNEAGQQTFGYNQLTGKYDAIDSSATNTFNGSYYRHQFGLTYNRYKAKLQYQLGLSLQYSSQQSNNSVAGYQGNSQYFTNIFPKAFFIYSFSPQKRLQLTYNGYTRQPDPGQLQPIPDYTNPLLIRRGNPGLRQEWGNMVRLDYRGVNTRKFHSLLWQLIFNNAFNKIIGSIYTKSQGIQEQQYLNVNGNYQIRTSMGYSVPVSNASHKGNAGVHAGLVYSREISFINGQPNIRRYLNWTQQLQLSYVYGERLQLDASAGFNWARSAYSIQSGESSGFFSHHYRGELRYDWPAGWTFLSSCGLQLNQAQQNLPGLQSALWNASLVKKLFANRTGELKISVFDILNDRKNFDQVTGDNYIETMQMEVVQRVFALWFVYHFR